MSTSRSINSGSTTHLLLYPYPAAGHIIPMLNLARTLLLHSSNHFTITLLVTPPDLHLLNPLLSLFPSSFHHLLLPLPPPPLHRHLTSIITSNRIHLPHIENWFNSHPSPPIAIVSDFFLGWTQPLAIKLGIKRIVFSPSGAFALSVMNSIWSQPANNNNSVDPPDEYVVEFTDLSGSPTFLWSQLSSIYRRSPTVDCNIQDWNLFRDSWIHNLKSFGTIVNTFAGLESEYINHVKSTDHKVWAVGPLLPGDLKAPDRGGTSALSSDEVKTWLDMKSVDREHSVVFVCFGSRCTLSKKQLLVITTALDRSGVNFILSVRSFDGSQTNQAAKDDFGEVTEDYESRIAGRGLVIRGWAPQVSILNHRAVGAFLTHCGWNSVLEGLSAGVVMLTWPMGADQFTNAKLLVEQAGVGIRVGESTRVVPEVGELVQTLVQSVDPTRVERKRALKLRSAARSAVVKGGSSEKDLDDLIGQLKSMGI